MAPTLSRACSRETRGRSDGYIDGVEATRSHEDTIDATKFKFIHNTESRTLFRSTASCT